MNAWEVTKRKLVDIMNEEWITSQKINLTALIVFMVVVVFFVRCLKFGVKKTFVGFGKGVILVWFSLGALFMLRAGFPVAELSDFRKTPGGGAVGNKPVVEKGGYGLSKLFFRRRKDFREGQAKSCVIEDSGKAVKSDQAIVLEDSVQMARKSPFIRSNIYFSFQARDILANSSPFEDDTAAQQAFVKGVLRPDSFLKEVCGLPEGEVENRLLSGEKKEEGQKSKYPLGYGELFGWFECVRSGYTYGPGYHFTDCNKEWGRLVPYLSSVKENVRKPSAVFRSEDTGVKSVMLIDPKDVPKGLGYKAAVDWFDCMRGGGRSYGQGSGKTPKAFRKGCTAEWNNLMWYLNFCHLFLYKEDNSYWDAETREGWLLKGSSVESLKRWHAQEMDMDSTGKDLGEMSEKGVWPAVVTDEEGYIVSEEVEEINLRPADIQFVEVGERGVQGVSSGFAEVREDDVFVSLDKGEKEIDFVAEAAFFSPFLEGLEKKKNFSEGSDEGGFEEVEVELPSGERKREGVEMFIQKKTLHVNAPASRGDPDTVLQAIEKLLSSEVIRRDPRVKLLEDRKNYFMEFCECILNVLNTDERDSNYCDILCFKNDIILFYKDISCGLEKHIRKTYFNALCSEDDNGVRMVNVFIGAGHKYGGNIIRTLIKINSGNPWKSGELLAHAELWSSMFQDFGERVEGMAAKVNSLKTPVSLRPELQEQVKAMEEASNSSDGMDEVLGGFLRKTRKRLVVGLREELDMEGVAVPRADAEWKVVRDRDGNPKIYHISENDEVTEVEVSEVVDEDSEEQLTIVHFRPRGEVEWEGGPVAKKEERKGDDKRVIEDKVEGASGESAHSSLVPESSVSAAPSITPTKKAFSIIPEELSRVVFDTIYKDDPRRILLDDVCVFRTHRCMDIIRNLFKRGRERDRLVLFNNNVVAFYREAAHELDEHIAMQYKTKTHVRDIAEDEGSLIAQVFVDYAHTHGVKLIADLVQQAVKGRRTQGELVDALNTWFNTFAQIRGRIAQIPDAVKDTLGRKGCLKK